MKRIMRGEEQSQAFRELGDIFHEQSNGLNEQRMAARLQLFARRYELPEGNLYKLQKRFLRPIYGGRRRHLL